jgi:hypothetical protein
MVSLRIANGCIRESAAGMSSAIEATDGAQMVPTLRPTCAIQEKDLQIFTEKLRTEEDDNKDC